MKGAKSFLQSSSAASLRGEFNLSIRSSTTFIPDNSSSLVAQPSSTALGSYPPTKVLSKTSRESVNSIRRRDSEEFLQEILVTPPPASPEPVLLLEGDEYVISHDGIARTFYQMKESLSGVSSSAFAVEELYDLKGAQKQFLLRRDTPWQSREGPQMTVDHSSLPKVVSEATDGVVLLGEPLEKIHLQEINEGVFVGAGTGATTWESSIAMSMFFASHPECLRGDVIELGSGVGLGGILCATGLNRTSDSDCAVDSITLTDHNAQVLEQCQKNIETLCQRNDFSLQELPLYVSKLDWYDSLLATNPDPQKYDTIVACDCAYLYPDITALVATMKLLLRDEDSRIHIFGPHNRSGLQKMLRQLQEESNLVVTVHPIEMNRYRLKSPDGLNHGKYFQLSDRNNNGDGWIEHECSFAAVYESRFLHIVCKFITGGQELANLALLSEID